ncbi:MAG: 1-acyl-sn-glycerol-3-phosphate acyltransferase [Bacteroidales bacterium]|nr:1-acyl-sn-glycerol-3-phosphate acyltransferase [Bacteroidales bacterium]
MFKDLIDIKDFERFSPIFKGKSGNYLAKFAMRLLAMDRVNKLYLSSCGHTGSDFAASLLNELGVCYQIGNIERLKELPKGSFITISNHPYGGLDGIMLIDLMAGIRPDYKVMVNEILSMIKPMDVNFISVRPKGNKEIGISSSSINGVRKALESIQDGHPIGFFPSGAVSDLSIKEGCVRDREWQMSIIRLIQKANVPVVPIRFIDKNSWFFFLLGLINWRVRLIRMPYEVFNKSKQNPRIAIGNIIPVEKLNEYKHTESLRSYLRKSVYEMPKPTSYTSYTSKTTNSLREYQ